MDAMAMKALKTKTMYGRARLFGQVGFGVGSYVSGLAMGASMTNIFLVHAALAVPTIAVMMHQSSQNSEASGDPATVTSARTSLPPSPGNISSPALHSAQRGGSLGMLNHLALHLGPNARNAVVFFAVVFVVGTASGVIENFAFNRISQTAAGGDIGGYLGLFTLLSSSCGAPMFWLSGKLIQRFGVNAILAAALGTYTTRFFIYSFITAPWQAMPAEVLRGMTFAAFWAASTYYVFKISPPGHTATMVCHIVSVTHAYRPIYVYDMPACAMDTMSSHHPLYTLCCSYYPSALARPAERHLRGAGPDGGCSHRRIPELQTRHRGGIQALRGSHADIDDPIHNGQLASFVSD
jgi:hypothetical protein